MVVYSHCIFAAAIIYLDALTGVAVPIMRPANSIAESDMDGCSPMQQSQKQPQFVDFVYYESGAGEEKAWEEWIK